MTDMRRDDGKGLVRDHPWSDSSLADLYDVFPFEDDIPLYLDLARRAGRVLEVACGSGRVLVPLAAAGCDVVGLDRSLPMLRRARAKLRARGGSACLLQADMRSYALKCRFDFALIAVRSFSYLLSREDQLAALRCVRFHLVPGASFVLDLFNPRPGWLAEADGSRRQDLAQELPDGSVVTRVETVVSTDLARQVRIVRSEYELIGADGSVRKRIVEWPFRYIYRFEAELLLERAGFEVEKVWGGYDGAPFSGASGALVILARAV